MNYQERKAKYAYSLYKKGLPFKKAYAVVEKDGKFVVLYNVEKNRFALSGGGVEKGESSQDAAVREVLEEMNINVEIIRSLGVASYPSQRRYKSHAFELECQAEFFYARFISYGDNTKIGLKGEFNDNTKIAELTKEEMLKNLAAFTVLGIKLD